MDFMTQQEYDAGIRRVLISEEELQEAIRKAGAAIDKEYAASPCFSSAF